MGEWNYLPGGICTKLQRGIPRPVPDPNELFLENLSLIERLISSVCRREGMGNREIEEFAAAVKLRLLENNCAVIRAFQGRTSFATYILAVIARALLDLRDSESRKEHSSVVSAVERDSTDRASAIVRDFLSALPAQDRLLFRLRSASDMTISEIARAVNSEPRRVYRCFESRCAELREKLRAAGIEIADVGPLVGQEYNAD